MGKQKVEVIEKTSKRKAGEVKKTLITGPSFVKANPKAAELMAYRRHALIMASATHHYFALRQGIVPVHPSPGEAVRMMIFNTSQYLKQPSFQGTIYPYGAPEQAMLDTGQKMLDTGTRAAGETGSTGTFSLIKRKLRRLLPW